VGVLFIYQKETKMTQIDDKEYDLETKQKTNSVCGSGMNAQAAVLQTARMAYSEEALPKV
jgi:hypothetical protein